MKDDFVAEDSPLETGAELVHLLLRRAHDCKEPFTVIFSGKKSKKVNGFYRPSAGEIVIHEKNFTDEDGQLHINNKSELMYTALHELAHHVCRTEYGQDGARSHTKLFYAVLDELADRAEKANVYAPVIDAELQKLVDEAQKISCGIARLQRELGAVLAKLNNACVEKGVRFNDVLHRKAQISVDTANKAAKMNALDLPPDINADIQEAVAGERDGDRQRAMINAVKAGKSIAQIKNAGSASSSGQGRGEKETDNLLREKERLEKTIDTLKRRLREVMERINNDAGLRCAADRRIE